MEVSRLSAELKHVEVNGCTLSCEERTRLELGFNELRKHTPGQSVYFWGKIRGTIKDYFIVYVLNEGETVVPCKQFFWASSSNFIFSSMPHVSESDNKKLCNLGTLFTGEFDTVLIKSTDAPKVIDSAAGIVLPPKHLTELDRLSCTVSQVDNSCSAVPRGALKYTPLQQVKMNEAFCGLSVEDSNSLCNWSHFRDVQQEDKKALIARNEAVYNHDFLDSISCDKPNHAWSIVRDTTNTVAVLRSQLWPGYYAYHRCHTAVYGSVYIGDGIQNLDLPFML